jgi:hypothetical protein
MALAARSAPPRDRQYAAAALAAVAEMMTTQPPRRRAGKLVVIGVAFLAFGTMLGLIVDDYPGWGFMAAGVFVALVGTGPLLSRGRPENGPGDDLSSRRR